MPRYKEPIIVTGIQAGHNCHYEEKPVKDCQHIKTFQGRIGVVCSECGEIISLGEPTRHPIPESSAECKHHYSFGYTTCDLCGKSPAEPREETKKISTKYELTQGNIKLLVKVSDKGLTITNAQGGKNFVFEFSKKETIKSIGELLIKASKL